MGAQKADADPSAERPEPAAGETEPGARVGCTFISATWGGPKPRELQVLAAPRPPGRG